MPKLVRILLFNRFSNLCLASVLEPLRAASDLHPAKGYHWFIETLDGRPVGSSSGITLVPDDKWDPARPCDYLIVLCSYGIEHIRTPSLWASLQTARRHAKTMIGVDMGGWLLARAGLVSGQPATVHHLDLSDFAETFLDVEAIDQPIVWNKNNDLVTCQDAKAAMTLAFELIEADIGGLAGFDVETLFAGKSSQPEQNAALTPMANPNLGPSSARVPTIVRSPSHSPLVNQAIQLAFDHMENPLSTPQAATALKVTPYRLNAKLTQQIGRNYKGLSTHLRLNKARQLADNSALSALEIAVRTGYCSSTNLHRAYRAYFGVPLTVTRSNRA